MPTRTHEPGPSDRAIGAAIGLASFALYAATLCPTVYWYDSAEYVAMAATLGLPHPPSAPLYVLLAHPFTYLSDDPAFGPNLFSASCGGLCAALAYAVGRQLRLHPLAAGLGSASFAVSYTIWDNANVAEVYTPGIASVLGVLWLLLAGLERGDRRRVVGAALLAGIAGGVHLTIATAGLGFAVLALGFGRALPGVQPVAGTGARATGELVLRCAIAGGIGLCVLLLIPLSRPAQLGNPDHWRWSWMMATGGPWWDVFELGAAEGLRRTAGILRHELGLPVLALAALGVLGLTRRLPLHAAALVLIAAGNIWFFYDFDVHDQAVFLLIAVAALCLLAGAGADVAMGAVAARARRGALVVGVALLGLPLAIAADNYERVDKRGVRAAREFGEALAAQLPLDAILVNDNSPEAWRHYGVWLYMQRALGRRSDVGVLHAPRPALLRCYLDAGYDVFGLAPDPRLAALGLQLTSEGPLQRVALPGPPRRERRPGDPAPACRGDGRGAGA